MITKLGEQLVAEAKSKPSGWDIAKTVGLVTAAGAIPMATGFYFLNKKFNKNIARSVAFGKALEEQAAQLNAANSKLAPMAAAAKELSEKMEKALPDLENALENSHNMSAEEFRKNLNQFSKSIGLNGL